ncbi:MAG: phosphatase PAP2 family protein [Thermoleophilaceae bacterium]|nr:phosphatase PAP2 family protein [Thermoleophilaceae bacterium]
MEVRTRLTSNGRVQPGHRGAVPLLDARPGGPAERFAGRLRRRHPAAVFFAALLAGFALLAAISIALGLLVTDVLLQTGGLAHTDESTVKSLVADRTPFLTDASEVGSTVGGAPLLPIMVGALALVCAFLRQWRIAAFAVFVLVVESATYRATSLAVPRERPHVQRLEDLPVDASYPSGHTAAAVAVYVGLVLLLTSRFHSRALRVAAWAGALLIPVFVALARMYRGMHHPLDVAGGLVVGIGALLVLLFACRAAGVAHAARSSKAAALAPSRHAEPVA